MEQRRAQASNGGSPSEATQKAGNGSEKCGGKRNANTKGENTKRGNYSAKHNTNVSHSKKEGPRSIGVYATRGEVYA